MSKRDDINILYRLSRNLIKIYNFIYWIIIVVSFILLFVQNEVGDVLRILYILLTCGYVGLFVVDNCIFWFNAEATRRKESISNGFGIKFHEFKTDGYYNNDASPSVIKYAENIFESTFFSKNIAKKMLIPESIKFLLVLILFIISCMTISDKETLLTISQTIFSSYFIINSIELYFYYCKLDNLYEQFYNEFVTIGNIDDRQTIVLLKCAIEYEAIKAYYKVRLSEKIFKANNAIWSSEWETLSHKFNSDTNIKEKD